MNRINKRHKIQQLSVSGSNGPPGPKSHIGFVERDTLVGELEMQLTKLRIEEAEVVRAQQASAEAARYYASLFHSAPVGYLVLNSAGMIMDINPAGADLLQRKISELKGRRLTHFIPQEQAPVFFSHLRRCRTVKSRAVTELAIQTPDGVIVPVELVTSAEAGPNNSIFYRTVVVNIGERKDAELAYRESERNYRTLVDSVQGIVWEGTEQPGVFTFISGQAAQILGYPPERWLREPEFWENRLHPADKKRVFNAYLQAVAEKNSFLIEFRMYDAERHVIWLRNSANVVRDSYGRIRLRGVMVNITELKEAEEALREETRTLETINHIGTLLAGELDLSKLVAAVTNAAKQLTGAKFGAFFYKRNEPNDGELSVYLTPGATRDIFEALPMPQHHPGTPLTETEREAIRIDDLLHDPQISKKILRRRASPDVARSYLAVPVVSRSDELLGKLLFAHPAPDVFTERAQHLLTGIAAEAGIALDNARLYRAVSNSAAHFRQLADAMPQIVWSAEADGRIDYLNRRWYEFTGLPKESPNNSWLSFLHPEDFPRCTETWKKSIKTGRPFEAECRLLDRHTGEHRWHLIRAVPNLDENGHVVGWFGTCTDIGDQKRVEGEIRDLNTALEKRVAERTAQLQASNRELEAFSYSVSHDLRAPLRSIDAFSQLVLEDYSDKLDEQGREYLGIVGNASRQMGQLIDDLLHLSRVTRSELRSAPVDLSALADGVIANLRQLEPERHVNSIVARGLQAQGDGQLLRIVLENLINNAWKFTGHTPDARIELGAQEENGERVFFVRDNGAGFDMAYANKLFSAFQRLHSNSEFPGHGIGLATVQRIIHRHGGRIWANAAVGHGATFYFTLPQ
jgi:PAS domain S-box-containing protein